MRNGHTTPRVAGKRYNATRAAFCCFSPLLFQSITSQTSGSKAGGRVGQRRSRSCPRGAGAAAPPLLPRRPPPPRSRSPAGAGGPGSPGEHMGRPGRCCRAGRGAACARVSVAGAGRFGGSVRGVSARRPRICPGSSGGVAGQRLCGGYRRARVMVEGSQKPHCSAGVPSQVRRPGKSGRLSPSRCVLPTVLLRA